MTNRPPPPPQDSQGLVPSPARPRNPLLDGIWVLTRALNHVASDDAPDRGTPHRWTDYLALATAAVDVAVALPLPGPETARRYAAVAEVCDNLTDAMHSLAAVADEVTLLKALYGDLALVVGLMCEICDAELAGELETRSIAISPGGDPYKALHYWLCSTFGASALMGAARLIDLEQLFPDEMEDTQVDEQDG